MGESDESLSKREQKPKQSAMQAEADIARMSPEELRGLAVELLHLAEDQAKLLEEYADLGLNALRARAEPVSRPAAEEEIESIESTNTLRDIYEVDLNSREACQALTLYIARCEEQIELLKEGIAERLELLNQNAQLAGRAEEEKDHIQNDESLPSERLGCAWIG